MPDGARPPRFFAGDERAAGDRAASTEAISPAAFRRGEEVALPPAEAHHAAHVLRLKAGQAVELFDGRGASALARIVRVRRDDVACVIEEVRPPAARPEPVIRLAFAVPKGRRLDWLLEKVTELGVASLQPVVFERSVAGGDELSASKRRRWLGHCIAAAKQAGVDFLPSLEPPLPLAALLAGLGAAPEPSPGDALRLYGDPGEDASPILAAVSGQPGGGLRDVRIVVGPEGGLAAAERVALNGAAFRAVRLGRTTLRTETAAIALVAAVVALRG